MASIPKVSVVMSVYNGKAFLDEAVESVLNQTYEDFEFIIINDGSSDGSKEILKVWASRDNRVRLVHQANKGLTTSLNRGLRLARGQYIARMDADDISLPTRFEKQVAYLDEHPSVGVLGTNAEHIGEDGDHQLYSNLPNDPAHIAWSLLFTCPLYHPSVMMRRDLVLQTSGYDASIPESQDYDLWTRLTPVTDFANLQYVGIKYRWWGGNMSLEHHETLYADAAASAARLHSQYLQHREHPAEKVARFFFDRENISPSTEELTSYFDHTINLYAAFVAAGRYRRDEYEPVKTNLINKLESFAQLMRQKSKMRSRLMRLRILQLEPGKIPEVLRNSFRVRLKDCIRLQ